MTTRATSRLVALIAALVLLLGTFTAPSSTAADQRLASDTPSQHKGKDVVHFSLYYDGTVAPKRIFFYANSGPYLRGMHWENWGKKKAVGRGYYISKCASCAPPKRRAAVVRFSKLRYCKPQDVYYYKRGIMKRKPSEGQTRRVSIGGGDCGKHSD